MAEKIKVRVCTGTVCYVMGGAELLALPERLPPSISSLVEMEGATCLGRCKSRDLGKPPFAEVDGEMISEATVDLVIEAVTRAASARA